MGSVLGELARAFRTLARQPLFVLTAVVTLGLGIGATTAIFSVVSAVLIQPLPYREPDRVVIVWGELRARGVRDWPFSNPDFADVRRDTTAFEGLAAVLTFRNAVQGPNGEVLEVKQAQATTNIFSVLGVDIARGSGFTEADGVPLPPPQPVAQPSPSAPPQAPPPPPPQRVVLSHEFWQRQYNGDESIVGRTVPLGPRTIEVAGVLAPGVELLFPPGTGIETKPDFWTPMRVDFAQGSRHNVGIRVVGRLKPGVTAAEADAEVEAVSARLRQEFALKETAGLHFRVEPMKSDLVADVRAAILALMGAVLFVLLIACVNVGNLLLARSSARERELAVRAALGAGRWRLVRQLLFESLALAVGGAVVGLGIAQLGILALLAFRPDNLPRIESVGIDPTVLGFAALATLGSAVACGLVPAVRTSRANIVEVLHKAGRTAGLAGGARLRTLMVIAEVTLSFVLLVGAGLMVRSFVELNRVDPGFDPNGVLTFRVNTGMRFNGPDDALAFLDDLTARLRALPGVTAATSASSLPLDGSAANIRWGTEEARADPAKFQQADVKLVQPGYFEAMRTPFLEGRTFTAAENRPDALYVIIDDLLARKAFPGESAVGKRILSRFRTDEAETFEVIGVVRHQRHASLVEEGREALFFASAMGGGFGRFAVRVETDPLAFVPTLRAALSELPGSTFAAEIQPMALLVERATAGTRFSLVLISVFAGIAAMLAVIGLYGVLSTVVRQRTPEIGVRMAFGAARSSVFSLVVGQGVKFGLVGVGIGVLTALGLTRVMTTMLVGVTPTDPATFIAIVVLFTCVTVVACAIPAFRASRVDPIVALREE